MSARYTPGPKAAAQAGKALYRLVEKQYSYQVKEIDDWVTAINAARNLTTPRRDLLADLYKSVLRDNHLAGCIRNRVLAVTGTTFEIRSRKTGKTDPEKTRLLRKPWFYNLRKTMMEARFFGVVLVEFLPQPDGTMKVKRVPDEHISPTTGEIIIDLGSRATVRYVDPPYSNFIIQFGEADDLGLLLAASPEVIWKKYARAAWSEFAEIFGMPMRIAKTNLADTKIRAQIEKALRDMGSAAYAILPNGTELELKESTRQDAYKIFDMLTERCNSEMSKLVLGATMTTDNGSSKSQAEVHERVTDTIKRDDLEQELFAMNDQVMPLLALHGFAFGEDDEFVHVDEDRLSLKDRADIVKWLMEAFEVDIEYVRKTFGVPLIKPISKTAPAPKAELQDRLKLFYGNVQVRTGVRADAPDKDLRKLMQAILGLADEIHDGTTPDISDFILGTGEVLNAGLEEGWPGSLEDLVWNSTDNVMTTYLRENVYAFSGARSFSDVQTIRGLLFDDNGRQRTRAEFRQAVREQFEGYNLNYLNTEYNDAVASAQSASNWARYEKDQDLFPNITYSTAGDQRVRPEHAALDGITLPLNHPLWKTHFPPNGNNCRCDTTSVGDGVDISSEADVEGAVQKAKVKERFLFNPGAERSLFSSDHPYYDFTPTSGNRLQAVKHYGMRDLEQIYADPAKLGGARGHKTRKALEAWWKKNADAEGYMTLHDSKGTALRASEAVRDMLSTPEALKVSAMLGELIGSASEVWSQRQGESLTLVYVTFLQDTQVTVVATATPEGVEITGITLGRNESVRTGILITKA